MLEFVEMIIFYIMGVVAVLFFIWVLKREFTLNGCFLAFKKNQKPTNKELASIIKKRKTK